MMGCKSSKEHSDNVQENVLKTYQQLINKGFDNKISMTAATKYPTNLQKAIQYIHLDQKDKPHQQQQQQRADSQNSDVIDTLAYMKMDISICDGVISHCSHLKRLMKALIFHKTNHDNNENIQIFFNQNQNTIIDDYHHLLDQHLNEDNLSKIKSDKQFQEIYNILIDKND
eukprot:533728_1